MRRNVWLLPLYTIAAASAGTILGSLMPSPWLWPLVTTLLIYPLFATGVRRGQVGETVGWMLLWAFTVSVVTFALVAVRGPGVGESIIRGPSYAREMMHWVGTGEGAEGSPSLFLPIHARHYGAFVLTSVLSGGFIGLYFGTILLNYMNFYVSTLATVADHTALAYVFGWPVWATVRVVGYVAGGAALAHFFYARMLRQGKYDVRSFRRWIRISLALVVLDVLLKATLAEPWRGLLQKLL